MRILILANNDSGLYKFRKELIEKLLEKNEVYISLPYGEYIDELVGLGCKYIETSFNRHGKNPLNELKLIKHYKRILKHIAPDVVLTYTIKPNIYGGIACASKRIPYICNVTGLGGAIENGGILGFVALSLYRYGLRKAHTVFFQNSENMAVFKENKIAKNNCLLIPGSGVNLDKFSLLEYPNFSEVTRFLFVGRIMKDKGVDEILFAAQRIKEENIKAEVHIVGWNDGHYQDIIEKAVNDGLIVYHGKQNQINQFLAQSHCIILPSYHEGMSNVLLEAAASGRPVIATNVPGCKETFDEGITGFGCSARDGADLFTAMKKFTLLSYEEKKQMGIRGRKKMELEFDRNIIVKNYLNEISEIQEKEKENVTL